MITTIINHVFTKAIIPYVMRVDRATQEEGFEPPKLYVSEKRDLLIISLRYLK